MAEKVDYGFEMEEAPDGKGVLFRVNGAGIGAGAWVGILFCGVLFGGLISLIMMADTIMPFLLVFGASVALAFVMNKGRSASSAFEITPNTVKSNGKEYDKTDIAELLIRNSAGKTAGQANVEGGTVVVGYGVTGMAYAGATTLSNSAKKIGDSAGRAIQESMAKRGNAVCIRYGRKVIPLAKNMQEDDAVALFNKVAEVL